MLITRPKVSHAALLLLLIVIVWNAVTTPAFALSCAPPTPEMFAEAVATYPIVFVGTVTAVDRDVDSSIAPDGVAYFAVSEVFKGEVTEEFALHASYWGDPFLGQNYIIFTDSLTDPAYMDCTNVSPDWLDFDPLPLLGEGYVPLSGAGGLDVSGDISLAPLTIISAAAVAIGLLALGVLVGWFGRKRITKEHKWSV